MSNQESVYIGSFDPYEEDEFTRRIIRVTDGITGLPVMATAKLQTDKDVIAYIAASIKASYDKDVVVIHVERESSPYRIAR